jgi:hypothetical protein
MNFDDKALLVLGILVAAGVYFSWRLRRVTRGVVYRAWLLFLLSAGYVGTFLLVGGVSQGATLAVELAIGVAVGALTAWYVMRSARFHQREDGRWVFQTRVVVLAFWFGLFVARVLVEFFILGKVYLLDSVPIPALLTPEDVAGLMLLETLFAAATGILLGSNVGVWLAYRRAYRTGSPPSAPEPSPVASPGSADVAPGR